MKLPQLVGRRRIAAAAAGLAVVVLLVTLLAIRAADDGSAPTAGEARVGRSPTTVADEGPDDERDDERDDGPTTVDPGEPEDAAPSGPTPPDPDPAPAPVVPEEQPPSTAGSGGGAAPADSPGGGEGANVERGGVVEPDDAESPPATRPAGPQGPVAREPCTASGPPTVVDPITDGPSGDGGRWVTVGALDGNCGASGSAFATTGVDTRLVFRSDADQLVVFLDDVDDPDATAGYADLECRSSCAGSRILVNPAGRYRIRVQATDGPWVVAVQEHRR